MANKSKNIHTLIFIISFLFLMGCNMSLKKQIENYSGDGDIHFFDAPFLGTPGCVIKMPDFDLSNEFNAEYNLNGIPSKMNYLIFLVVPEPCPIQKVLQGRLNCQIKKNGQIVKEANSKIKDLRNSEEPGINRFYFSGENELLIEVNKLDTKWSLSVNINADIKTSVQAYIEISSGGFK